MNPGIFYLYEYNNTQKLRNAGFLKITRYYHSCTLQFNARGIPVSYADTIKIYVFYLENNLTEATVLTEITCANHALSARITSAESQFPGGRTLDNVDGFFLLLPNGHILAATAPGISIDVQKLLSASDGSSSAESSSDNTAAQMEIPSSDIIQDQTEATDELSTEDNTVNETPSETETADETAVASDRQNTETAVELEAESVHEYDPDEPSAPTALKSFTDSEQTSNIEQDTSIIQESPAEQDFLDEQCPPTEQDSAPKQNTTVEQDSPHQSIRKIQRSELSVLPRKYWHLANNSFLLHGYHNYNHLILIEKDGHYWLGVPGIYDPHEARAARLFGFPQFTDSYNKSLQLSDDECNPEEKFGYWCCYLK